jgi:hypothetical protein
MKYLRYSTWILILLVTVSSFPQLQGQSRRVVEMRISPAKQEYLLGEPVKFDRSITIPDDVRTRFEGDTQGAFRVFIAKGKDEFRRYQFKGWIGSHGFDTIFFNSKPETDHLSEYGRREAEAGMILTDYAFPEPGEYRIKASYKFSRESDGKVTSDSVWSNVITITLKEPKGDDLRMWELMKEDSRIGFFLMQGEAPIRYPSILEAVLAKVDRTTSDYPNSYLAGLLKIKAQERRARREHYKEKTEQERLKREKDKAISVSRNN